MSSVLFRVRYFDSEWEEVTHLSVNEMRPAEVEFAVSAWLESKRLEHRGLPSALATLGKTAMMQVEVDDG